MCGKTNKDVETNPLIQPEPDQTILISNVKGEFGKVRGCMLVRACVRACVRASVCAPSGVVGLDVGEPVLGERVLGKPVGTAVGVRVGVCALNSVTLLDANVEIKVGAEVGAKLAAVTWH